MNYAEMSDFEINCAVALTLGMSHAFYFPKSEDDFCEGIDVKDRGPIWQSGKYEVKGYRVSNGNCFNPCHSWADASPIIEKHKICLAADVFAEPGDGGEWVAQPAYGWDSERVRHNNPLRAAMIVFLMMRESK